MQIKLNDNFEYIDLVGARIEAGLDGVITLNSIHLASILEILVKAREIKTLLLKPLPETERDDVRLIEMLDLEDTAQERVGERYWLLEKLDHRLSDSNEAMFQLLAEFIIRNRNQFLEYAYSQCSTSEAQDALHWLENIK